MTVTDLLSKVSNVPANTINELAGKVATGDIDSITKLNNILSAEVLDKSGIYLVSTDLDDGTALTLYPGQGAMYHDTFTSDRTLTFSGTPTNGTKITLNAESSAGVVLTIPACRRTGTLGNTTSIILDEGWNELVWVYVDSYWWLIDTIIPNADQIDDSTTAHKFVTASDISKLANVPADTNSDLAAIWVAINELISSTGFPYNLNFNFESENLSTYTEIEARLSAVGSDYDDLETILSNGSNDYNYAEAGNLQITDIQ